MEAWSRRRHAPVDQFFGRDLQGGRQLPQGTRPGLCPALHAVAGVLPYEIEPGTGQTDMVKLRIGGKALRQDLDRDDATQPRVTRLVDLPHPAGADGGKDLVRPET